MSPATRLGEDRFGDSQVSISCIGLCTAILLIGVSMLQQAEVRVIKLLEEKQEELHLVRFFLEGSSYPQQLSNLSKVFTSADQVTIATHLANKAVERSLPHELEDRSHAVTQKLIEILSSYRAVWRLWVGASAYCSMSECIECTAWPLRIVSHNVECSNCKTTSGSPAAGRLAILQDLKKN